MVTDYAPAAGRERSYVYILAGRPGLTETNVKTQPSENVGPAAMALLPGYPNPFNNRTVFPYRLESDSPVKMCIFNIKGEEVRILFDGFQQCGTHHCVWDGTDRQNNQQSSGIYFCVLWGKDTVEMSKIIKLN